MRVYLITTGYYTNGYYSLQILQLLFTTTIVKTGPYNIICSHKVWKTEGSFHQNCTDRFKWWLQAPSGEDNIVGEKTDTYR